MSRDRKSAIGADWVVRIVINDAVEQRARTVDSWEIFESKSQMFVASKVKDVGSQSL